MTKLLHWFYWVIKNFRSIPSEEFLGKRVLEICSTFIGEQPCCETSLKSHFGMGVFLQICCILPGDLFIRTPRRLLLKYDIIDFSTSIEFIPSVQKFLSQIDKQEETENVHKLLAMNFFDV